jgi:hypothetical protein
MQLNPARERLTDPARKRQRKSSLRAVFPFKEQPSNFILILTGSLSFKTSSLKKRDRQARGSLTVSGGRSNPLGAGLIFLPLYQEERQLFHISLDL